MELKGSLLCSQEPSANPFLSQINPVHITPPSIQVIFPYLSDILDNYAKSGMDWVDLSL
jgi:hypothetical protein